MERSLKPEEFGATGRLPTETTFYQELSEMELAATQQATQPLGENVSMFDNETQLDDDTVLILHPSTPDAHRIVEKVCALTPQHIWQNEDLEHYGGAVAAAAAADDDDDMELEPYPINDENDSAEISTQESMQPPAPPQVVKTRDIALRFSSKVHDIALGWCFGRDPKRCDIIIVPSEEAYMRISSRHFRIFVSEDGVPILEDTSTNGTIVDDFLLKGKGDARVKRTTRVLEHGSIIEFVTNSNKNTRDVQKAKFIVRFSLRRNGRVPYYKNLVKYLTAVKEAKARDKDLLLAAANHQDGKDFLSNVPFRGGKEQTPTTQALSVPEGLLEDEMARLGAATARNTHGMHWDGAPKYSVVTELGKGAFATVYKLVSVTEGIALAAKELEKRRFMKNGILDMSTNHELEIMKKLTHPHIVKLLDWQDQNHHLYIIMEYVKHGDLLRFATFDTSMPEAMAQSVTRQTCHALRYLHDQGVVHRDVKPDNILIASLNPFVIKLSDFGLSKMVGNDNQTFLKTFCGTLLYCAPEVYPDYERVKQGLGRRSRHSEKGPIPSPYSSAVDLWSLGAVMFHLVAGVPPFTSTSTRHQGINMLEAIMRDDVDLSPLYMKHVSEDCIDFFRKLIKREAAERPSAVQCMMHPWLQDVTDVKVMPTEADHLLNKREIDYSLSGGQSLAPQAFQAQSDLYTGIRNDPSMNGNDSDEYGDDSMIDPDIGRQMAAQLYQTDSEMETKEQEENSQWSTIQAGRQEIGDSEDDADSESEGLGGVTKSAVSSAEMGGNQAPDSTNTLNHGGQKSPRSRSAPTVQRNQRLLFGEVNQGQESESGVFGTISVPIIQTPGPGATTDSDMTSPERSPTPNDINTMPPPPARPSSTNPTKRVRDDSQEGISAAKRSMTVSSRRPPISTTTTVAFSDMHLCYGRLTPVPGSITAVELQLNNRVTCWGRYPGSTHIWADMQDTRVPKAGFDIVFWCPEVKSALRHGEDWKTLPGLEAIIQTRSSKGIKVNGTRLKAREKGAACLVGKLKTGDIIEVFSNDTEFLKYRCDFFVGESVAKRESSFVIEESQPMAEEIEADFLAATSRGGE